MEITRQRASPHAQLLKITAGPEWQQNMCGYLSQSWIQSNTARRDYRPALLAVHLFSDPQNMKLQQSAEIAFALEVGAEAKPRLLVFATQGSGHGDEIRILDLLRNHHVDVFPFDRRSKVKTALRLLSFIRNRRPDLVVMEGTGFGGGAAIIIARLITGVPYVVSSGDAIAPFLSARIPLLSPLFWLYEKLLCRLSSGFIGWTPYLVGRALVRRLGAPRTAMTVAAGSEPHFPRNRS